MGKMSLKCFTLLITNRKEHCLIDRIDFPRNMDIDDKLKDLLGKMLDKVDNFDNIVRVQILEYK